MPKFSRSWGIAALFLIMTILLSAPFCRASSDDEKELKTLLNQIETASAAIDSFTCQFEQKRYISILSKAISFYGSLAIDRPDKLRWQIDKPLPSVLVLNGKEGLQCSGRQPPRHFNTLDDPIMKTVAKQLWSWLSGNYQNLTQEYSISLNGEHSIKLTPLAPKTAQIIAKITVFFEPVDLQPAKVEILEASGDRTEIFFSSYLLNTSLTEGLFRKCSQE